MAALALALGLAVGCTRAPAADGLKLMIWGDPAEVAVVRRYVDEFRRLRPEVGVTIQHAPSLGFREKLEIRLQGGDIPDVFYVDVQDFEALAERGVLLDLEPFAAKDPEFRPEAYFPEVLNAFRSKDGRLRAIGKDFATLVLYYNADLFDAYDVPRPGKGPGADGAWTWDEFLAAARALTRYTSQGKQYGFVVETWFGEWAPWVWQNGGEIYDETTGRWLLGAPEHMDRNAEALDFLAGLIFREGVAPRPSVTDDLGTASLFQTGRVAMCTYGRWMCMQFKEIRDFEWNVVPLPRGRSARGRDASSLFTVGYGIAAQTKRPREAWELVQFLTGREGQDATADAGMGIPALRAAAESERCARPAALGSLAIDPAPNLAMVPVARPAPRTPRWREVNLTLRAALDPVFRGATPAREALTRVQPEIERILAR